MVSYYLIFQAIGLPVGQIEELGQIYDTLNPTLEVKYLTELNVTTSNLCVRSSITQICKITVICSSNTDFFDTFFHVTGFGRTKIRPIRGVQKKNQWL
jgi:hypothetical protein